MRRQKGFSLIELLIVVAIILIIAAIAIPNLLRAKMSANEASAVRSVRTLLTAEISYATACNAAGQGYTTNLAMFAPVIGPTACPGPMGYVDDQLSTGTKAGYIFTANDLFPDPVNNINVDFEVEGHPIQAGSTGQRAFCATQSAAIFANTTGAPIVTRATCIVGGGVTPVGN